MNSSAIAVVANNLNVMFKHFEFIDSNNSNTCARSVLRLGNNIFNYSYSEGNTYISITKSIE